MSSKVLVAGASGLVGFAAARHFMRLPGWQVLAVSRRVPQGLEQAKIVSVDLLDAARCAEVFGAMRDVTHLVYAALYEKPGLIAGWRSRDQMDINLRMLRNLFEPLARAAASLQHVTLLQGTKAYGSHIEPVPVPARERSPRHAHENFYWLQEDYLRAQQQGKGWHWTVLRPQVIFGESLGSHMNSIPAIGVYGALLKEAGEPLYYPGGPPRIAQAVDADLLARACAWAAVSPACRNETFNINNGEAFEWRTVWPAIADALGMKPGPPRPMSLAQEMPKREAEWAAIVRKYRLRSPQSLEQFVGQSFIYTDRNLAYGQSESPGADAGEHGEGAPCRIPRLRRHRGDVPAPLRPAAGVALATAAQLIARQLAARPDAPAFIDGERQVSYAQFDALCRSAAAWLAGQGIGPGDRVALWLVNRIEWLALFFGAARLGAAVVAINTRYRAAELAHLLERSGARLLVMQPNFRGIDFAAVLREVNPVDRVAVLEADPFASSQGEVPDRAAPDAIAAMFSTSGTTRGPKLVMHPQRTLVFHSLQVAKAFGLEAPGARLLAATPFCGVYGFTSALGALAAGAPIVMMETFDAAAAVALLRRHAVTHLFGSDEMVRRMLELAPGHDPFPSARVFGYAVFNPGGAELAREAWAKRVPLFGLYGSSEVQALFSIQDAAAPLERRIEAGGRPAAGALAQIRIRDVETGELLPPERSGEIEIRAPSNFTGYWNDAAATAEAVHADGFFRTGDIGRLHQDGTFVYETRKGDAMRLGGYLVSPLEIEDALKGLPGVADVQVVAVEISGHARCVAFVIPGAQAPCEADLLAAAARKIAAFKVPSRVWFVDEFPTTQSANGVKIQRGKLREMALERLRATPP